jgi:protein-tyrosine phosphatase
MPAAMLAILAPYQAGAWLSSRWHTRGQPRAHEIADGVWLGRIPLRRELDESGIVSVVDLTAEFPFPRGEVIYRGVPMLDLLAPAPDQLHAAAAAIRQLEEARPTLVFCALGFSRSAAAVAAWLIESGKAASADQAVEVIRSRRPYIVLPASYCAALNQLVVARADP